MMNRRKSLVSIASAFALVVFGLANASNAASPTLDEGDWTFIFIGAGAGEKEVNNLKVQGSKVFNVVPPTETGAPSITGKITRRSDLVARITDGTNFEYVLDGAIITSTHILGVYRCYEGGVDKGSGIFSAELLLQ